MKVNKDWLNNRCVIQRVNYKRVIELLNGIDQQTRNEITKQIEELKPKSKYETRKELQMLK